MGANNSSGRVSFESDEKENVTVVKGIRLSDNVIKRMREPPAPPKGSPSAPPAAGSPASSPLPQPAPPLFSSPPPPSLKEPVVPPTPTAPSPTETVTASAPPKQVATAPVIPSSPPHAAVPPAPPPVEQVTSPPSSNASFAFLVPPLSPPPDGIRSSPPNINQSIFASSLRVAPSSVAERVQPPLFKTHDPCTASPAPHKVPLSSAVSKHATIPLPPPRPSEDAAHSQHALPEVTGPHEPSPPPPQPQVDPAASAPVPPHASVLESAPVSTPAAPAVDEEAQKKKISDDLYQSWEQKRASAEQEQRAWIEEKKARLSAQAEVQTQLQDDAFRMSSSEKAVTTEDLQHTLMEESIAVENEKRRVEIYAKQLQAREANVQKQDAFYRQHVARLEERSAQFYKATTESYHKAADEVNAKFKRYEVHPVCADLQGQIFKCYRENASRTLLCSDIAALYQQCVNNAKQDKLTPGG